eukprot:2226353-Rhodomonas_salina.3
MTCMTQRKQTHCSASQLARTRALALSNLIFFRRVSMWRMSILSRPANFLKRTANSLWLEHAKGGLVVLHGVGLVECVQFGFLGWRVCLRVLVVQITRASGLGGGEGRGRQCHRVALLLVCGYAPDHAVGPAHAGATAGVVQGVFWDGRERHVVEQPRAVCLLQEGGEVMSERFEVLCGAPKQELGDPALLGCAVRADEHQEVAQCIVRCVRCKRVDEVGFSVRKQVPDLVSDLHPVQTKRRRDGVETVHPTGLAHQGRGEVLQVEEIGDDILAVGGDVGLDGVPFATEDGHDVEGL